MSSCRITIKHAHELDLKHSLKMLLRYGCFNCLKVNRLSFGETRNQSGGINVALKTPSLHGKHTEYGAKDWQH